MGLVSHIGKHVTGSSSEGSHDGIAVGTNTTKAVVDVAEWAVVDSSRSLGLLFCQAMAFDRRHLPASCYGVRELRFPC